VLRAFFSPCELADVPEQEFRERDRLGYRAKFIGRYAEFFAANGAELRSASGDQLVSEFQRIKGVGPYTAAVIASHASRDPSALAIDVWNRKLLAQHLMGRADAPPEEVMAVCHAMFPGYEGLATLYIVEHCHLSRPVAPLIGPDDLPMWNDRIGGFAPRGRALHDRSLHPASQIEGGAALSEVAGFRVNRVVRGFGSVVAYGRIALAA
jgi:hypothetical protein